MNRRAEAVQESLAEWADSVVEQDEAITFIKILYSKGFILEQRTIQSHGRGW